MVEHSSRRLVLILLLLGLGIASYVANGFNLGLDLQGGSRLVYRIDLEQARLDGVISETADNDQVMAETLGILADRIDPQGILEATITRAGSDRILIELPGENANVQSVKRRIEQLGSLEMRMVAYAQLRGLSGPDRRARREALRRHAGGEGPAQGVARQAREPGPDRKEPHGDPQVQRRRPDQRAPRVVPDVPRRDRRSGRSSTRRPRSAGARPRPKSGRPTPSSAGSCAGRTSGTRSPSRTSCRSTCTRCPSRVRTSSPATYARPRTRADFPALGLQHQGGQGQRLWRLVRAQRRHELGDHPQRLRAPGAQLRERHPERPRHHPRHRQQRLRSTTSSRC